MEYCSIDFETANKYPNSACSLGMKIMDEDGRVVDSYYSLIRPKILFLDPLCYQIHHLELDDIAKAPTFEKIWPEVKDFIGNRFLVAHNASFDMNVLKNSLYSYSIKVPEYEYYCTLQLSRKLLKNAISHKLTSLAEDMGIEYRAHNAEDDAYVCGRLFHRLCGDHLLSEKSFNAFIKSLRLFPKFIEHKDDV